MINALAQLLFSRRQLGLQLAKFMRKGLSRFFILIGNIQKKDEISHPHNEHYFILQSTSKQKTVLKTLGLCPTIFLAFPNKSGLNVQDTL